MNRIAHIDAWRFIAVLMVIIFHILTFSSPWYREHLPWIIMGRAQPMGLFGVKIFFCISGFVICRGLLSETKQHGAISIKAFYVRRLLRIVPPLLVYMLALAVLNYFSLIDVTAKQFLYAGAFICNFDFHQCGWFLAHTWSLAYEEQFYLVFPTIFALSLVFGGRRIVLAFTLLLTICSVSAALAGYETAALAFGTFCYMLMGCVFAMYWDRLEPLLGHISVRSWFALSMVSFLLGCLLLLPKVAELVIGALILPAATCAMILSTPIRSKRIAVLFLHPLVTYLGKISFTLYLWQQLATSPEFIQDRSLTLLAVAATVGIGMISYRYLERPLMHIGAAYSKRVTAAPNRDGVAA